MILDFFSPSFPRSHLPERLTQDPLHSEASLLHQAAYFHNEIEGKLKWK